MRTKQILIAGLLLTGSLTACKNADVGPTDQDISQANQNDILTFAKNKGLNGKSTVTGVYVAITKPSAIPTPVAVAEGLEAELNYTIYALLPGSTAGTIVERLADSSFATKSRYLAVVATNLGLTEGLLTMREGDQADILLPSFYGFGRDGSANGLVPANTPIRLDTRVRRVRTEEQQISEYLTANKLTPSATTASGARIVKTAVNPAGALPSSGQTLAVRYRGQLLRSTSAFDSTGTGTAAFKLGDTVPGFNESLATLRVGEKATIVFPSKAGYGATGRGGIPPYAPLRFDIELISAQ